MGGEVKQCSRCGVLKPTASFYSASAKIGHIRGDCKDCNRKSARVRKCPTASRARHLKRLYGLTPESYQRLFDSQRGACAICNTVWSGGKRLAVDHCHVSGIVRGLLCANCNNGLGRFKDNSECLSRAIKYLQGEL